MIDWLLLAGALLAGLVGSLHCVAMCGGIATGIAMGFPRERALAASLRLNLGRVAGYSLAGAVAGGLGAGIVALSRLESLQLGMRLTVGLVLMLAGLRILLPRARIPNSTFGRRLWQGLQPLKQRVLPANTAFRQLALGALWGWLPCGLSATLLTAAWLSADALQGALTMSAFGLGTLATMVPLTWSGSRAGALLQRPGPRRAAALLLIACGALTIAAPWLAKVPALHAVLAALGCRTLG
jgi:uncharacterized protein